MTNNETFSTVEQIANGKGLSLRCKYNYQVIKDGEVIYWSYFLKDIVSFLKYFEE